MKCSYCGAEIKKGTGIMYVHKNGDINYFCSNTCYKNSIVMRRKINKKIVARNEGRIVKK
ncbi:MAG: 50S ribosomal protein L24e [Candidatus Micrarchaeia archaeon]